MITRRLALPASVLAIALGMFVFTARPAETAPQKPVDKTGLDILCSGKGDVYSAPSKAGVSMCIFADGDVLVCDSKKDKCWASMEVNDKGKGPIKGQVSDSAMTLRLVQQLNHKVDQLNMQLQALSRK